MSERNPGLSESPPGLWVGQEHANGCALATAAMICGRPYGFMATLVAEWSSEGHTGNWETSGVTYLTLERLLSCHGFYTQRKVRGWFESRCYDPKTQVTTWTPRPGLKRWPVEPFAPIHYCSVEQPSGRDHFVVMLADGAILDPLREGRHTLADWPGVNSIVGLVRP